MLKKLRLTLWIFLFVPYFSSPMEQSSSPHLYVEQDYVQPRNPLTAPGSPRGKTPLRRSQNQQSDSHHGFYSPPSDSNLSPKRVPVQQNIDQRPSQARTTQHVTSPTKEEVWLGLINGKIKRLSGTDPNAALDAFTDALKDCLTYPKAKEAVLEAFMKFFSTHAQTFKKNNQLFRILTSDKQDSMMLITYYNQGFSFNEFDENGFTLLHHAALNNNRTAVEYLLYNRARVREKEISTCECIFCCGGCCDFCCGGTLPHNLTDNESIEKILREAHEAQEKRKSNAPPTSRIV